jgi:hypothetical protein
LENKVQLTEIYQIPPIPPKIKAAVLNGRIAVFIGAGASRMIGCSGWKDLAKQLAEAAYEKGIINYHEKEKIIENYNPRKIITIFKGILPDDLYRDTLKKSLSAKEDKINRYPIYDRLFKMRGVYLTTNIDTYFDQYFEPAKIFVRPHQFKPENIRPLSLFHLHGSVNDFNTIIFTTRDYIDHYNKVEIKDFLRHIFTQFTVLFVGYSLSELEILDYVLLKGSPVAERYTEFRHSVLLPFYSVEQNILKFESEYYANLRMLCVPYAIDENGYDQLYYLIEAWEKEINIISPFLYKSYEFLEQNIDDYIEENAIEVFQLIKNDDHFKDHFFRNLRTVKWFYPLKGRGYFEPEKAPGPKPAGKEGSFVIPEWNILPYLERISQQVVVSGNEKYIDELLKIINDVSKHKDKDGKHIDNFRVWLSFVKILLSIPNEKIPLEIIELIEVWQDSNFDVDLLASEVGTKLLPKFLLDGSTDDDIQKAEKIVESITLFKTLRIDEERAKSLSNKLGLKLAVDPYWLKEVFEKYSENIGDKCTNKVIEDLTKKIRILLEKRESKSFFEIDNMRYWLELEEKNNNYFLKPSIPEAQSESEMFETILLNKKIDSKVIKEIRIDKCKKDIFVDKAYKYLIEIDLFQKADTTALKKTLGNLYFNLYNEGTYESFYKESEIYSWDVLEVFTQILKRILNARAKHKIKETVVLLRTFLEDDYLYFHKMALYIIGQNIENYNELFWELIDSEMGDFMIDNIYFSDEIKHSMQNLKDLPIMQKEKLKAKIEAGPKEFIPDKDSEKYIARWKQKRYQALSSDPYFKELYDEKKKITKVDIELTPAIGKIEVRSGSRPSPLKKEEFVKMTNEEIARFLSDFKPKDFFEGTSVDGISLTIKEIVREMPEKIVDDMSPFLSAGYFYVYDIISGIKDAWNNKKRIAWEKVFKFISQYISRDDFWGDKYTSYDAGWNAKHEWVIGEVGELIQEGTKDDNWAFEESQLSTAQQIIFYILDRLRKEKEEDTVDPVNNALNSTHGKIVTALIFLALRIARLGDKKEPTKKDAIRWSEDLKIKYEKMLIDEIIESYTLFGQYMPNLYYLDKLWVEQKIKEFETLKNERLWSSFMAGYLFLNRVYDELYKLMGGNYLRAISYSFKERDANESLAHHIAIGYLRGVEDFSENSLLGKILADWNVSQMEELVNYLWMQNKPLKGDGEINDKIVEFWRIIYKRCKEKESLHDDDKKILTTIVRLSVYLPRLDKENYEWLMLSASNMPAVLDSRLLIEYLDDLKDKGVKLESARYAANIFLKLLESFTPTYKSDHIKSIVEYLYDLENDEMKELANRICNIYGSREIYFLRELYEKYQ